MANTQSVRRHLDAFTRGRIIGKLEEGRSVTSAAEEFELLTASFHDFGDNFKLQERGFSSGRPRETTPADDRHIVLQARRNRRQTVEEIARHTTQRLDDRISRFTVARRLHGGGLFAQRPYESRLSLSSDAHRIHLRESGEAAIIPRTSLKKDRYGGRGVFVWGGIMLGSRTDLQIRRRFSQRDP
ncbi:transposable element Tcb1 transposase [Trichonephila clavipes]|nr:transposable element Tcb1 transposase [Trichonephila clavipes]